MAKDVTKRWVQRHKTIQYYIMSDETRTTQDSHAPPQKSKWAEGMPCVCLHTDITCKPHTQGPGRGHQGRSWGPWPHLRRTPTTVTTAVAWSDWFRDGVCVGQLLPTQATVTMEWAHSGNTTIELPANQFGATNPSPPPCAWPNASTC